MLLGSPTSWDASGSHPSRQFAAVSSTWAQKKSQVGHDEWMNSWLFEHLQASIDSCSFRNLLAFLSQNTYLPLISTPKMRTSPIDHLSSKSSIRALASCHSLSTRTLEDTNHRLVGHCQVGHYSMALTIEYCKAVQKIYQRWRALICADSTFHCVLEALHFISTSVIQPFPSFSIGTSLRSIQLLRISPRSCWITWPWDQNWVQWKQKSESTICWNQETHGLHLAAKVLTSNCQAPFWEDLPGKQEGLKTISNLRIDVHVLVLDSFTPNSPCCTPCDLWATLDNHASCVTSVFIITKEDWCASCRPQKALEVQMSICQILQNQKDSNGFFCYIQSQ